MNDFYGDNNRWFLGKVISVQDPLQQGRVRVRIFGIHPENLDLVREADLPWAQVVIPTTEGGVSGIGNVIGIKRGSQVFGIFLDGHESQLPLVLGSIPRFEVDANKNTVEELNTERKNITLYGNSNAEKAFNFFLSRGFSEKQAAGIVGNLIVESNVNPIAINDAPRKDGTIEGSFGIAQWNPGAGAKRLQELAVWCGENNKRIDLLETQLEFIIYELYRHPTRYGLHKLKESESIEDAVAAFERYERPEGWTRTNPVSKSRKERVQKASEIYSEQTEIG
jgi:hypothetical protein